MKTIIEDFKKELYILEAYIQQLPTDYQKDVEEARQCVTASIFCLDLLIEEIEGYKFRKTNIVRIEDIEQKDRPKVINPLNVVKGDLSDLGKIAFVRNLAITYSKKYYQKLTQGLLLQHATSGNLYAQNILNNCTNNLVNASSRIDQILQKIKNHEHIC